VRRAGITFENKRTLTTKLRENLPFELTGAQVQCIRDIFADMCSDRRMQRLLQGDVGSGKTIVALFAALLAMENGFQAAVMAPTELLAEQHIRTMTTLLAQFQGRIPSPLPLNESILQVWPQIVSLIAGTGVGAVTTGLSDCEWPGRLEWLRLPSGGEVLLDAAHNPSGASALANYLSDAQLAPLPIVFAAMRDKDVKGMLAPLQQYSPLAPCPGQ